MNAALYYVLKSRIAELDKKLQLGGISAEKRRKLTAIRDELAVEFLSLQNTAWAKS